jgi:ABC-type transport system involved in multi-copper enzyme maturation permease subunit
MLATLIVKELRGVLLSPKFAATFAVCAVLLLLSVFVGIREYQEAVRQHDASQQLTEQTIREQTSWRHLANKAVRSPDPMQIFVSGVTYDIGRWSEIAEGSAVKLESSAYSDDPIFALFRHFDFAFVVQFVFSLLAILFTFDAISGEREAGTMRLVFSNAVPRAYYLVAKVAGSFLGLIVPLCLPILLSLLLVQAFGVPLTAGNWVQIGGLIGVSLLYTTAFIVIGLLVSALTRWSNVSFLVSLVVWVMLVLIIPRAGIITAGQLVQTPTVAEIEGARETYSQDLWNQFQADLTKSANSDGVYRGFSFDSAHEAIMRSVSDYESKLVADLRRKKAVQEQLGLTLSRFSPAAAYQLAAQSLAGTDVGIKIRYEDAMQAYHDEFSSFVSRQKKEPQAGGVRITIGDGTGIKIDASKGTALDLTNLPRFQPPQSVLGGALAGIVIDAGLLILSVLVAFAGSFVAFLRYDVR